jgi:hypothetical protein
VSEQLLHRFADPVTSKTFRSGVDHRASIIGRRSSGVDHRASIIGRRFWMNYLHDQYLLVVAFSLQKLSFLSSYASKKSSSFVWYGRLVRWTIAAYIIIFNIFGEGPLNHSLIEREPNTS